MTVKLLRKLSALEKDEINDDGSYVCSQNKLIGPMHIESVCDRHERSTLFTTR